MACSGLGEAKQSKGTQQAQASGAGGTTQAKPRAVVFRQCPTDGLTATKIMSDGSIEPARQDASIDKIAKWLLDNGYTDQGALVGEERELVVTWLQRGDEPEYLTDVVGKDVRPATAHYVVSERKIATTMTRGDIIRLRHSNPKAVGDLQYVEKPTRAQQDVAHGLAFRTKKQVDDLVVRVKRMEELGQISHETAESRLAELAEHARRFES